MDTGRQKKLIIMSSRHERERERGREREREVDRSHGYVPFCF
jgi:hypothetical protein